MFSTLKQPPWGGSQFQIIRTCALWEKSLFKLSNWKQIVDDAGTFVVEVDCNFLALNIITIWHVSITPSPRFDWWPQPPATINFTDAALGLLAQADRNRQIKVKTGRWITPALSSSGHWSTLCVVGEKMCSCNKMLQILWADGDVGSLKQIFPLAAIRP